MVKRVLLLTGVFLMTLSLARAGEKLQPELLPKPREAPGQEVLPSPRVLPGPVFEMYLPPDPPPQFGRRSVWQMMSPNYKGQMRPTVIYTPSGDGYYRYSGALYPWTTTRPHLYRGYLVD
jgi:hypothetical protein